MFIVFQFNCKWRKEKPAFVDFTGDFSLCKIVIKLDEGLFSNAKLLVREISLYIIFNLVSSLYYLTYTADMAVPMRI